TGRHGPAELAVQGRIDLWRRHYFDVTVTAKHLPLDAEVRDALPEEDVRKIWDQFQPAGTADGTVRVRQDGPGKGPQTDVALAFDGEASMSYQGFPYRIGGLSGQVRIAGSKVAVDSVTGDRGPMHCTVDGTLAGLGGAEGQTDLTIEATDFPLDANLIAALPAGTRKAVASLHPAGRAERVTVRLRQSPGEEADLRVVAHLRDAGFQAEACPYRVDGVSGLLTVRPGRLVLEGIRGRHGQTPVEIDGQVLEGEGSHGLDLRIRATGVDLGAELYAVLPAEVQRIWRKLSPSGQADVELSLRQDMPDDRRKTDYRLVLQGRGMNVRYEDFPYSLREIVGRAVATPEGVELTRVIATHGKAKLIVDGALRFDDDGESASLSVTGQAVPIDEELLAAVPKSLAPLAERFRPGGTCSVDLKELRIVRRVLAPGAGPATAPADANEAVAWSVRGQVGFDRATIDIGLGHKTLSGSLRGTAAQSGQGPAVEAEISLDSVEVGSQRLTKLLGRLRKQPHSEVMRLDDLSARAHGGRVAGLAEVRLADPLEFGVSLSVDGIQIADMVNAGVTDPAKKLDVGGLLAGNVQLTVKGGARPQRQASGVLRITHGKILRLPVMLGLLHVVYLALPGETAFTDGTLTYHLRDDTLVFNEIYLRGPALSIVGSGTLDMKTEVLDLKFLSGPPQKLPRLGSLTELLEGIAREVAEIHVTGTLQKPQMRTLPLRNLDRFLRDLMNPGTGR
ncbi:MAG TPA: AsmA-like C-terminal region-containing protein, partial [Phycisphaerae bacterium]|nr:AsmA-like C-terminal region-containing protein [Phycisphaerae bacterium]